MSKQRFDLKRKFIWNSREWNFSGFNLIWDAGGGGFRILKMFASHKTHLPILLHFHEAPLFSAQLGRLTGQWRQQYTLQSPAHAIVMGVAQVVWSRNPISLYFYRTFHPHRNKIFVRGIVYLILFTLSHNTKTPSHPMKLMAGKFWIK